MRNNARALGLCLILALSRLAGAGEFEIRDPAEFRRMLPPDARVTKLAGGMTFVEGPVWLEDAGGRLVFSDIPADALRSWSPRDGLSTFRAPSGHANGNTVDRRGRLVTAEHGRRRISTTLRDGRVVAVVERHAGGRFNSPNDVVVARDGSYWFTDPEYGLAGRRKEQPGNFVYRFDPSAGTVNVAARDFDQPNGLCFAPNEQRLFVADSGAPRHIQVYRVGPGAILDAGSVFARIDAGVPDGIRCDADGRVWSTAADGVHVFGPEGRLIAKILLPEAAANLAFGGAEGRTLFITARTSLYAIETLVRDAARGRATP